MLDLCATSWHRIVDATFGAVGRDQAGAVDDDQWGVDARYEGWLVNPHVKGQLSQPGGSNGCG